MPSRDNISEETLHVWKMWGKYYGYPACCVEAFLKGEQHFGGISLVQGLFLVRSVTLVQ